MADPSTTWTIRRVDVDDAADLRAYVDVVNAVTPEDPASVEQIRWAEATYPGGVRLLAEQDGRVVGGAVVGRVHMYAPDYERYWFSCLVLPAARRRGVGSALYRDVSAVARAAGKTGLLTETSAIQTDGIDFLTHRGFVETDRDKAVRLELAGLEAPVAEPPAGIDITTLADRPDLVAGIHAVAVETFPDMPASERPLEPGPLGEFRARDVDRPGIPRDAFMIALDAGSGEVVGYASLIFVPGSKAIAWHDMTTVRRAWRGRGVAGALKRATIAWALANGLEALETGNDVANAPMRAINARLGYRPLPDQIAFRGPLAPTQGPGRA